MQNILYNENVIGPSEELTPIIRIAPFSNKYLYRQKSSKEEIKVCEEYLKSRFGRYVILPKARTCIAECLKYYQVEKDDVVTILTTSGSFYISSCVTKTIEQYCLWSREITSKTKLIFVNHEFGYPFKQWDLIKDLGIPIIEDCAYAFGTEDPEIGKYSDFVIYSLPKFFPMQLGAILKTTVSVDMIEQPNIKDYVINILAQEICNIQEIKVKRIRNYNYLTEKLAALGIKPFFLKNEHIIPGTYVFTWGTGFNYPNLRKFMELNGVECSVFYGSDAFFIPMNHNLELIDLNYMVDLLKYYSNHIEIN